MKRQILLHTEKTTKARLEDSCSTILDEIRAVIGDLKESFSITFENGESAVDFLKTHGTTQHKEVLKLTDELVYIKYKEHVDNVLAQSPGMIKEKVVQLFSIEKDGKNASSIIEKCQSIANKIRGLGANIELEHFLVNDEFVHNGKLDTRLSKKYNTYCKNEKQVDTLRYAQKLKEVIEWGLKSGVVAKNHLGHITSNIIDVDTGEIRHHYIARIQ